MSKNTKNLVISVWWISDEGCTFNNNNNNNNIV